MTNVEIGTVVRDRKWGGRYTGTVTHIEDRWVQVAWHGSFVTDELDAAEVEIIPDAPEEQRKWRGGVGVIGGPTPDAAYRIIPITP